mmetsp:Transcript_18292/g.52361  ORF Transcript_18292/g.52361 Transcript_18292/m.52361 type:complete len:267 (-) Transcript_18292:455-1255(-)
MPRAAWRTSSWTIVARQTLFRRLVAMMGSCPWMRPLPRKVRSQPTRSRRPPRVRRRRRKKSRSRRAPKSTLRRCSTWRCAVISLRMASAVVTAPVLERFPSLALRCASAFVIILFPFLPPSARSGAVSPKSLFGSSPVIPTPMTLPPRTSTSGTAMAAANSSTTVVSATARSATSGRSMASSGVTLGPSTKRCTPITPERASTSLPSALIRSRTIPKIAASSCRLGTQLISTRWPCLPVTCSASFTLTRTRASCPVRCISAVPTWA